VTHDELRDTLGAYVLGALEPGERAQVAAHLETCAHCRTELAAITPLPGLLGRLEVGDVTVADGPPSEGPLAGALVEIGRLRRAHRRRLWVVAAAMVLVAGIAGVLVHGHTSHPGGVVVTATAPHTHVTAKARLTEDASGTTIALTLSGVPSDARCRLVVIGRDGHREVAGSWRASYAGDVTVDGATAMTRDQIASMRVVTFAGRHLVTIPVGSSA